MILQEWKVWALYWRVSELLLSPKEGWRKMKWKVYAEVHRPEKRVSSWEEGLSSLSEGERAIAESQRGWLRMKRNLYAGVQRPEKRSSSWEEELSSLPEGEWAVAESQRGMKQRMRRVITRQTKEMEKESIRILFDATLCVRKFFYFLVKTCKDSCKHIIMGRVPCSDEKERKKERKKERSYSLY